MKIQFIIGDGLKLVTVDKTDQINGQLLANVSNQSAVCMYYAVQDSCRPIFGRPEQYQVTISLFQLSNCNLWQSCTFVRSTVSIK